MLHVRSMMGRRPISARRLLGFLVFAFAAALASEPAFAQGAPGLLWNGQLTVSDPAAGAPVAAPSTISDDLAFTFGPTNADDSSPLTGITGALGFGSPVTGLLPTGTPAPITAGVSADNRLLPTIPYLSSGGIAFAADINNTYPVDVSLFASSPTQLTEELTSPTLGTYQWVGPALPYTGIVDSFVNVDLFLGTANLYAPDGTTLISSTTTMKLDTAIGPDVANQMALDTTLPTYVQQNIIGLIGNTDVGMALSPITDPNASDELYSALTTQPVPFTIASDTGNVAYGQPFEFVYGSPLGAGTNPGDPGFGPLPPTDWEYLIYTTNVNVTDRVINEVEIAVPEPGTWLMLSSGAAILLLTRTRRRAQARAR